MKIFTSCVSQKNGDIIADISKIKHPNLHETFYEWLEVSKGTTPARDVYKGSQWEIIKQVDKLADTYICSAGYGRLQMDTLIVPYSITFSSAYENNNHLLIPKFDSTQKEANQEWWLYLTFNDKVHNPYEKDETYIITVNPQYIDAFGLTFDEFRGKDNVIILTEYKLGRLAKWLKTGVNNLNVTFTKWLLENEPQIKSNTELQLLVTELDKKYGEDIYQKRNKCDDDFIKNHIKNGGNLNQLRNIGYSCSTKRFNLIK
jgi:hypothetical protein